MVGGASAGHKKGISGGWELVTRKGINGGLEELQLVTRNELVEGGWSFSWSQVRNWWRVGAGHKKRN
jgi:hypothetical protein